MDSTSKLNLLPENLSLVNCTSSECDGIAELVADLERLTLIFEEANQLECSSNLSGQMHKIRADQVRNNAGGYVFEVSDKTRVRRFLILGTSGGTYYSTEHEITMDNVKALCDIIEKGKGLMVLREIVDISVAGRAPRQNPTLFALALCARYQLCDTRDKKILADEELAKRRTTKPICALHQDAQKSAATVPKKSDKRKSKSAPACECSEGDFRSLLPLDKYLEYQRTLQKVAFMVVPKVCRIPTHLFMFVKYCKMISSSTGIHGASKGWGRAMRATVSNWYFRQTPERLAMHITKYQNREGYSHRDIFRLCHIRPKVTFHRDHNYWKYPAEYDFILNYVARGTELKRKRFGEGETEEAAQKIAKMDTFMEKVTGLTTVQDENAEKLAEKRKIRESRQNLMEIQKSKLAERLQSMSAETGASSESIPLEGSKAVRLIRSVEALRRVNEASVAAFLIRTEGLVREHVPSELLNSKEVWSALLLNMPMTAMIRNLGKMASVGLLDESPDCQPHVNRVTEKLRDEAALQAARIHPISVLLAANTYKSNRGVRGSNLWPVNPKIVHALERAFLLAFKNVAPTNKRFCLALDVSGSMDSPVLNSTISCRCAAAAMSMVIIRTEEQVETVAFSRNLTVLPFNKLSGLEFIITETSKLPFSGTDCALPMIWALNRRKKFDVFVVFTDNETWCGKKHPFDALRSYREHMNLPKARLMVIAMTATNFTIADPEDSGMLDVCGFDSAIPELLREFANGGV